MLIYGRDIREKIKEEIRQEAEKSRMRMVVIQVGDNTASQVYVNNIRRFGAETGINVDIFKLSHEKNQEQVLGIIEELNNDPGVTGIMLQKPLPDKFNADLLVNTIDYRKDVEGLHNCNLGKLITNEEGVRPSTPKAIITILKENHIPIEGQKVTIVGRSSVVGHPLAAMMTAENGTVTLCHSRTVNLKKETLKADILVTAIGKANIITPDMVTEEQVIIDAGINFDENGTLCGDVHPEAKAKARIASAVPGGVGTITVAELFNNLCILKRHRQNSRRV